MVRRKKNVGIRIYLFLPWFAVTRQAAAFRLLLVSIMRLGQGLPMRTNYIIVFSFVLMY